MTQKERAKVTHEINNVWHTRYAEQRYCVIITHSNKKNSPAYSYRFINHGFDDYEFLSKRKVDE